MSLSSGVGRGWLIAGLVCISSALFAQTEEQVSPARTIDLLKRVDVSKHVVRGAWELEDGVLHAPDDRFSTIELPIAPPEEYDLHLTIRGAGAGHEVILGLAFGNVQFAAILNAPHRGIFTSGLDLLDRNSFHENPTTLKQPLFTAGVLSKIVASVRKEGVSVAVDGTKIIEWMKGYASLSLHGGWRVPHVNSLFIGSFKGQYQIEAVSLRPISGAEKTLVAAPPPETEDPDTWITKADDVIHEEIPNWRTERVPTSSMGIGRMFSIFLIIVIVILAIVFTVKSIR